MIVCSAIKTHRGEIITGKRHPDCIRQMAESGKYTKPVTKDAIQGFMDDAGNFLGREDARAHFLACGQFSRCGNDRMHPELLFSEDLY